MHQPIRLDEIPAEIIEETGRVSEIRFPRQGYTSDVGIIESPNGRFLLKRTKGLRYGAWLAQELLVLHNLRGTKLPVPAVYRSVEHGDQLWTLMQYVEGETVRSALLRETSSDIRHEIIYHFGAALARIHATPCPSSLKGPSDWLDDMLLRADYNLRHYTVDGTPELLARITNNKPVPVRSTLIHGDYTIDNVLVREGNVTAVIDWSGGSFGDPRYDAALAIRPKPHAFQVPEEADIFFAGYGAKILNEQEYAYFKDGLNEFF